MSLMDLVSKVKLERKSNLRKKVAIGTTIGVAVGAVAGVMLAPKTGKETRDDLAKNIQELPDKTKELFNETQELVGEVKEKIIEKAHKIMSGVKEVSSDIKNEMHEASHFKKPIEITEEQVDAFKKKLK